VVTLHRRRRAAGRHETVHDPGSSFNRLVDDEFDQLIGNFESRCPRHELRVTDFVMAVREDFTWFKNYQRHVPSVKGREQGVNRGSAARYVADGPLTALVTAWRTEANTNASEDERAVVPATTAPGLTAGTSSPQVAGRAPQRPNCR
jgi:hypothetical protein